MKNLGVFIFPGVQTLDLFGPLEMLGLDDKITITLVAQKPDPLPTRHGQRILPDATISDERHYDLLLIPGDDAAIPLGRRPNVKDWLIKTSQSAELVMTVCTGSILLAMTGVLDGKRATTNKQDYRATTPLGPNVNWVEKARWVQDGKFFTSSGVSAGMDMSLAVLAQLFGQETAEWMADGSEYDWHDDSGWDPFAEKCGLGQKG